ncbi:MAG: GcrA family cell cycle regulator, partial [Pseudomonadota bacterium]
MGWTEERVEKLKELWAEGMSASKIAKELGGVTRNAVIGKIHRLGLSNRAASPANGTTAAPEEAPTTQAPEPAAPAARPEPEPAPAPVVVARREPVVRDASQPRPPGQPTPEEESARATLAEIEKMARKLSLLELTERT